MKYLRVIDKYGTHLLINEKRFDPSIHRKLSDEKKIQAKKTTAEMSRAELLKMADELNVKYWSRIPTEMLKERVEVALEQ